MRGGLAFQTLTKTSESQVGDRRLKKDGLKHFRKPPHPKGGEGGGETVPRPKQMWVRANQGDVV